MLEQIALLDSSERASVLIEIDRLRDHWIPRGGHPASFFTLGPNCYMDLARSPVSHRVPYFSTAGTINPILIAGFGEVLSKVADATSRLFGRSATFEHNLALPGFHIFLAAGIPRGPTASVHFDLQYELLDWSLHGGADTSSAFSFTLPILLPRGGGGLNVWDITLEEMEHFGRLGIRTDVNQAAAIRERRRVEYTPGTLVIHSGHALHQIGETADVVEGDRRITLQGHGMCSEGRIKLYW